MSAGIGNDTVTGNQSRTASSLGCYDALIRVSEALRAYHDRNTLFRSLANELRSVLPFSFLGLGLYDEEMHTVEPHVLEAAGDLPPPQTATDKSLTYWVVQHQEPVMLPVVAAHLRFPTATAYLQTPGL